MNEQYDVIVVGARVAGSSLAYLLAREGYKVLLLDRSTFPCDTLSTHNIYSNSLGMLRGMGVLDKLLATDTPIYRNAHINFDGAVIEGAFPESDGINGCLCIRRMYLDSILLEHARSQPSVMVMEGFRVTGLLKDNGVVKGVQGKLRNGDGATLSFRARLVVGADGRLSSVREWTGSEQKVCVPTDFASYVAYLSDYSQDGELRVEFYKNNDKLAIVFPTSDRQFVIGVMFPLEDTDWMQRFKHDPEAGIRDLINEGFSHTKLPKRLERSVFEESVRGLHGYNNDWYTGMGQGWALLGDALSFKDPAVGQGMHDALYGAHILADILSHYPAEDWSDHWEPMGEIYQAVMEKKLMSRFWMGCQFTKNAPVPPEVTAAYHLVGGDSKASSTFLGIYNYVNEPEDLEVEIGRLMGAPSHS